MPHVAVPPRDALDRQILISLGVLMAIVFFPSLKGQLIPFLGDRYVEFVPGMLERGIDDVSANFSLHLTERVPLTIVLAAATLAAFGMRAKLVRMAGLAVLLGAIASSTIIGFR